MQRYYVFSPTSIFLFNDASVSVMLVKDVFVKPTRKCALSVIGGGVLLVKYIEGKFQFHVAFSSNKLGLFKQRC